MYSLYYQAVDWDMYLFKKISTFVDCRSLILFGDFNSNIDWKTMQTQRESTSLLKFFNEKKWVWEPMSDENTLDLVFTTEDSFVEDVSVSEEFGNRDQKMIHLLFLHSWFGCEKLWHSKSWLSKSELLGLEFCFGAAWGTK